MADGQSRAAGVAGFGRRYRRQYGLVHQDAVEDLNVLVVGDSGVLPYLLLNLAFCGVGVLQGGVYLADGRRKVTGRHLEGQFLLSAEDRGEELVVACRARLNRLAPLFDLQAWPEDGESRLLPDVTVYLPQPGEARPALHSGQVCRIFGQVTQGGVYVGHEPVVIAPFQVSALTPALNSLAGAILAQEVLRLTNSIRGVRVVDQRLQIALRLASPALQGYFDRPAGERDLAVRLRLEGEALRVREVGPSERPDEALFTVDLPDDSLLSRLILDSVEVIEEPLRKRGGILPGLLVVLIGSERIEAGRVVGACPKLPVRLERLAAIILGAGGLGSWVSAILGATPCGSTHLTVIDGDPQVEEHNLNRQLLYTGDDLGVAKAVAAEGALRRLFPAMRVDGVQLEIGESLIAATHDRISRAPTLSPDSATDSECILDPLIVLEDKVVEAVIGSDVVLSCLDNMKARWVLNAAAGLACRPFVNGGVDAFRGAADLVDPASSDSTLVERYGLQIRDQVQRLSCAGPLPVLSIVTTNAIVASTQAGLAVALAAGQRPTANYYGWDGESRTVMLGAYSEQGSEDRWGLRDRVTLAGVEGAGA